MKGFAESLTERLSLREYRGRVSNLDSVSSSRGYRQKLPVHLNMESSEITSTNIFMKDRMSLSQDPKNISRLEVVPIRKAFPHEANNFTRWLEEHIDALGDRLGLKLSVTGREKRVGDFILDLECESEDGQLVVIENQLEKTNHSHLGQLLTYMVGVEAQIAIWIATEARFEHQQVIEWLNESSSTNVGFYLVRVEAVRIDESPYAPLFTVLASPTEQAKEIGEQKKEWAARHYSRNEFWTELLEKSKNRTKLFSNVSPGKSSWIATGAGISGIKFVYVVTGDRGAVELYIDTDKEDGDRNKKIFDQLHLNKAAIEKDFGDELKWDRLDGKRASRVSKSFSSSGLSDKDKWPELQDKMIDAMIRLEKALKPFLSKINI